MGNGRRMLQEMPNEISDEIEVQLLRMAGRIFWAVIGMAGLIVSAAFGIGAFMAATNAQLTHITREQQKLTTSFTEIASEVGSGILEEADRRVTYLERQNEKLLERVVRLEEQVN